jgi:dTDP-4-dehydrorhamnose reductase
MRLFLTGASGLVGSNILKAAQRRGHEVIAVKGSWQGELPGATRIIQMDLTERHAIQAGVLEVFPDAIINAAGVTEPFLCDRDREGSASINVDLPETLAQIAHHLSARIVHLSTEQVFDGNSPPYQRNDTPKPSNLYGRQKAESERRVRLAAPEHAVILRLPLLNGNSLTGARSLHERLFALWASGQPARLFHDEIRQPCGADNAAEVAIEICERTDLSGTFNWAGNLKTPLQDFATQLTNLIVPHPYREWYNLQE